MGVVLIFEFLYCHSFLHFHSCHAFVYFLCHSFCLCLLRSLFFIPIVSFSFSLSHSRSHCLVLIFIVLFSFSLSHSRSHCLILIVSFSFSVLFSHSLSRSLHPSSQQTKGKYFIHVLDTPGFQQRDLAGCTDGSSFDDLCMNYTRVSNL